MSQTAISMEQPKYDATVARVDMKLEVALIPVSDVDRAKDFYTRLGWRLSTLTTLLLGTTFASSSSHPPGVTVPGLIRQGGHIGSARLDPGCTDGLGY